ncbi:hypothetical protein B0I31_11294 [Saccharothrix carnea]|uniref:Uncharacterized protein n=1 Tax=Saccharothrix carnea TaxID=1280637 RepID=A0A2P8I2F3_SACCR|nr:hypothetical protein [Saccharothrix carnea]PSL52625.1 hypothetical protein B0I31_11294 [Saccharothrix carnea]
MIDLRVPVQIAVVWLVMGLSAAFVGWLVLFGFFVGSLLLVVIGLLGPFAVLFLVGTFTAEASPLTVTPLRRVGWAALVTVLGLVGAVFYSSVLDVSEPAEPPSWLVLPAFGVPFALVAAMLAHGSVVRLVAGAVTVAAVAFGIWLPTTMPGDDAASRIAHARVPGGVLLIATPEGYRFPRLNVRDGQATLDYTPDGPVGELHAFPRLVVRPATVETTEPVYRPDSTNHVFVRRIGEVEAVAVVADVADVSAARDFVLSVRPATDDEVERLLPRAPDRRDRDVLADFTQAWRGLL